MDGILGKMECEKSQYSKCIVFIPIRHTFLYQLYVNKYAWYKKIAPDKNDIFTAKTNLCICDLCDRVISHIY